MAAELSKLFSQVARERAEFTLLDLFVVLDLPSNESTLAKVMLVPGELDKLGLKLIPSITEGELESTRRIIFAEQAAVSADSLIAEIAERESERLELKSSLLFDYQRSRGQPGQAPASYKSDEVLHASLKTIAAFLNSDGGKLLVGVDDSGNPLGIQSDFPCVSSREDKQNPDGWELALRAYIKDKFKDGESINGYVQCCILDLNGLPIARLNISPRSKLSFVRYRDQLALYRRQGNQTVQVLIDQVEEFLSSRNSP